MSFATLLLGSTALAGVSWMSPAAAATPDWTGATSGNWFVNGNWSTNAVPTSADLVIIDTTTPNAAAVIGGSAGAQILTVGHQNTGTLTVSGGAQVNLQNSAVIGDLTGSTGSLSVTNAGALYTNGLTTIGNQAGSVGTVVVNGTNSLLSTTQLVVGSDGNGSLTVSGGAIASVPNTSIFIGLDTGSTGQVIVDGAGSTLAGSNNGQLNVGHSGTGTLTIRNGGLVSDNVGNVGWITGVGSVIVDGNGSTWTNTTQLIVANLGTGSLSVSNGGSVSVGDTSFIGSAIGSNGTASVDGANSTWATNGQLFIGASGNGTLTISNGGAVSATVGSGSVAVSIADQPGSTGVLNIGAAPGSAAVAPGTLNAPSVQFGGGTGTINFNHTGSGYVFAAAISGFGTINQLAGETILTADSSGFTGPTNVSGGRLAVNGSLSGSLVTVSGGGILGGDGTVGAIAANTGGIVAPGNSIGTLTVAGNVDFASGSFYQVEVNAAGLGDKIVAGGAATIAGGTVQVLAGAGNYAPSTNYTILTANGGVSGAFAGVTSNLAFLNPSLSYDATNVYLTLIRNITSFSSIGVTPNQIATGGGVESLGQGNSLYNAVLNLSAPQAQNAFDQLSGEIHASVKGVLIDDSRFAREAAMDRLRAAFDGVGVASMAMMSYADAGPVVAPANTGRFAVWGRGFGSWGASGGDGNAASINRSTGGIMVGGDARIAESWRVGMLGGYSHTNFRVGDRSSSGGSDDYSVGLYGGTQWGNLALRTGSIYTWHDLSTSRSVAFPGFSDMLTGRYGARTAQAFGEFGYRIDAGRTPVGRLSFEPFANLAYVNLATRSFTESGGAAALIGQADTTGVTFTTVGLRDATEIATLGGMNLTARSTLGWRHAFGDVTPLSTLAFQGGSAFTIAGVPIARDAAVVEAGLDLAITPTATLGVSYGGQFAKSAFDHNVRGVLAIKF